MKRKRTTIYLKRNGKGPCDVCRRKKRRCDGEKPCSRCVKYEFHCTYQQRALQRTAGSNSYVQSLEERLKTVEALLREAQTADGGSSAGSPTPSPHGPGVELTIRAIRGLNNPLTMPYSGDINFADLSDTLQSLSINGANQLQGFQGKSSHAMLVKAVVDLKSHTAPTTAASPADMPPASKPWSSRTWDTDPPRRNYIFPAQDLTQTLLSLYFSNINVLLPTLHRPTFEKALAINQHLHDDGFARTVLLVCALGARYSDDERIYLFPGALNTAGSVWFDQVQLTLRGQPNLYDLQCYCLAAQFLDRTSGPRACWTTVGFGIRLAQDISAHRSKKRIGTILPEHELEKRAYWVMVLIDAQCSAALGRSLAIQSHDFDLEMPVRCDDEYWEASVLGVAFQQSPTRPSLIDYLVCQLNLNRILSLALKILYSTNRIKSLISIGDKGWEQKLVVEFDSALNTWFDSIPPHLHWDPAREATDVFFNQSATLYCSYYLTRILIHRPCIPAIRRSANSNSLPSLTICTNAARACSHVAEIQQKRRPCNPLLFGQTAVFTAGIVLLFNVWGETRGRRTLDADLTDVHRCINVLRAQQERCPPAKPLLETLEQLVKMDRPQRSMGMVSPVVTPASPLSSTPSPYDEALPDPNPAPPTVAWPVYNPALETLDENDRHMFSFHPGPGEAPARAPRVVNPQSTAPTASPSDPSIPPYANIPPYTDTTTFASGSSSYAGPLGNSLPPFNSDADANNLQMEMDVDMAALWSVAPTGFEVSDWDSFLSNINNMPRDC
ncbi:fungal-specific transcription factor domain-containing protein [Mycena metata]|uniref:Fungal-specific transcription factor domain-containing protein n=1 Tax=Mycena metata TaxID=1033252 RepID=A0AAD7MLT5_9AGAR|nr:fungal-specific transcription factor domain-containing protein [Mycena metata]